MKVTFFGTGTSFGIPVINCNCPCCTSTNPHDKRFRSSIKIETEGGTIVVVDTGPEFRLQALKYGLPKLDGLFYTHAHADHLHGLDDIRVFSIKKVDNDYIQVPINLYATHSVNENIRMKFDYCFKTTQRGGGKPQLNLTDCDKVTPENPIEIGDLRAFPVPMKHGEQNATGWVFTEVKSDGSFSPAFAYLTDCSFIPESSLKLVENCSFMVIDALRIKEHTTHFSFEQATEFISKTKAKKAYFIHMCHDLTEKEMFPLIKELKAKFHISEEIEIQPSYDGMELFI